MSETDTYLGMVDRLEPDLHRGGMDQDVTLTSIAISLKRIADAMTTPNQYGEVGSEAIHGAISRGIRDGRP